MKESFYENEASKKVSCFLGCTSPVGFFSCFDDFYDVQCEDTVYILKGGPGTGKSTMMKKIGLAAEKEGYEVEYANCSSDPASLDGVKIPKLKVVVVDGTAPHIIEPHYPGICEKVIALGDYFDCEYLKNNREKLLALFREYSGLHKRAGRFIAAAGHLVDDNYAISCDALVPEKIIEFTEKTSDVLIPEKDKTTEPGQLIKRRLLSAVTPDGFVDKEETMYALCDNVYAIEDEYGCVSSKIMAMLCSDAVKKGYEVMICPAPLAPESRIERLIIPSLKMGFSVKNNVLKVAHPTGRIIHAARFTDTQLLRENRARMAFNKKGASELIDGAAELLSDARMVHDSIERYYIDAMDFSRVNEKTDKIIDEILNS